MPTPVTIDPQVVPNGTYPGFWCGYHVEFAAHGQVVEGRADASVRMIDAPCKVTVQDGAVWVELE